MKLIGEIENVGYNGMWIIRSEILPKIGSQVYNQHKQAVGKVTNIIGPVTRPYILVRPKLTEKQEQLQIIGEKIYINKDVKKRKKMAKR